MSTCHSGGKKKEEKAEKEEEEEIKQKIIKFLIQTLSPCGRLYFSKMYISHPINFLAMDLGRGLGFHWPTGDAGNDAV